MISPEKKNELFEYQKEIEANKNLSNFFLPKNSQQENPANKSFSERSMGQQDVRPLSPIEQIGHNHNIFGQPSKIINNDYKSPGFNGSSNIEAPVQLFTDKVPVDANLPKPVAQKVNTNFIKPIQTVQETPDVNTKKLEEIKPTEPKKDVVPEQSKPIEIPPTTQPIFSAPTNGSQVKENVGLFSKPANSGFAYQSVSSFAQQQSADKTIKPDIKSNNEKPPALFAGLTQLPPMQKTTEQELVKPLETSEKKVESQPLPLF